MRETYYCLLFSDIKKIIAFLVLFGILSPAFGQEPMVFIKATSRQIKVLDGPYLQDGELVPELNPDTYYFRPSVNAKKIAYYTDKDSLVFSAKAGDTFLFAIVLNDRDTCYQRVSSATPNVVQFTSFKKGLENDTLPFVLGPNNAIHLKGTINGSQPLDLIFDTGANVGVLSDEGKKKGVAVRSGNMNVFETGTVRISHSPAIYIDYHGRLKADGVLGYNAFDGQAIEINYDKNILVVHHGRIDTTGYRSMEMKWGGANMFVEGAVGLKGQQRKGFFLFDTGSRWALSLNKTFAEENMLYGAMEKTGTRRAKGADGKTIKSSTVKLPFFYLAGFSIGNVPADLENQDGSEGRLAFNILGNDVLKRFNTILDYKRGFIYVKPNSLWHAPYTKPFDEKTLLLIAVMVAVLAGAIIFFYRRGKTVKRKKQPLV